VLSGLHVAESPRWWGDRVWFSDLYGQRGLRGGLPDGRLLIGMTGHDHRVLRQEADGRLVVHADLVADHDGTAYVGAFGFDATGGPVEPGVL
jgi:sugar lactone lactonase YvrE